MCADMGWDLLNHLDRLHYFRGSRAVGHKISLCGVVRAPWSRGIPGMLEVSKDMCKMCLKLAPKRRWGNGVISG